MSDHLVDVRKFLTAFHLFRGISLIFVGFLFLSRFSIPAYTEQSYLRNTIIISTVLFLVSISEIYCARLGFKSKRSIINCSRILLGVHTVLIPIYLFFLSPVGLIFYWWDWFFLVVSIWALLIFSTPFVLLVSIQSWREINKFAH